MASEKAWYLVAAGILALGLTNSVGNSGQPSFRHIRACVTGIAEHVSTQIADHLELAAQRVLQMANGRTTNDGMTQDEMAKEAAARRTSNGVNVAVAFARGENRCLRSEAAMARKQAVMAEIQGQKMNILARRWPAVTLCPRQHIYPESLRQALTRNDGSI